MPEPDSRADLEFWSGRARGGSVGQDADPPRKPYRASLLTRTVERLARLRPPGLRFPTRRGPGRPSEVRNGPGGKSRPVAAAALLAMLAGAWLFVGHHSRGAPAPVVGLAPATVPLSSATTTATPAPTTTVAGTGAERLVGAIARAALRTDRCSGLSASSPHVLCFVDGAVMEAALYARGTVGVAFRRIAGPPVPPRSGPAACAAGRPDERAWSQAAAPLEAVGRYVCRVEGTRAAIWWTNGDRLLHAEAADPRDADLAKLFSWWRAHPSA